jgi:hypothetical protein
MKAIGHALRAVCLWAAGTGMLLASPTADSPMFESPQLSAAIDREVETGWQAAGAKPAVPASDAEFLRRVYLDLVGTIPSVSVARDFLEDTSSNKRAELVDRLLDSPRHTLHFARVLRARLAPEATKDFQTLNLARPLDLWLRKQVAENVGYDKLVRDLLSPSVKDLQQQNNRQDSAEAGPRAWLLLKESKPENLAAGSARALLGLRIECAQCHDHPFEQWKRDEFWSYAAFFSGLERIQNGPNQFQAVSREVADRRELGIPGTGRVVQARFLDGNEPDWKPHVGARVTLAQWMTTPDNPFFARAMVNRTWAEFFGTGLVDPVDDMGPHNRPSHPALLDELAQQFAAHSFDIKYLMRAIVLSRPYQLSSALSDPTQGDRRLFARLVPRGLTPDQLKDSLQEANGGPTNAGDDQNFAFELNQNGFDQKFALTEDTAVRYETSIIQALEMMNGQITSQASSTQVGGQSHLISAVMENPFMATPERIETLFLATLTRPPTPDELARVTKYVEKSPGMDIGRVLMGAVAEAFGKPQAGTKESVAMSDVYWALLNSPEFLLNH